MDPLRRRVLRDLNQLFDYGAMGLALVAAEVLVHAGAIPASPSALLDARVTVLGIVQFVALFAVWHVLFDAFGLYRSHRLYRPGHYLMDVAKATTACTAVLAAGALAVGSRTVTGTFIAVFWSASTTIIILSRFLSRWILSWLRRHGRNERHVLVVGSGSRAVRFARELESDPRLGYHVIGFVDDPMGDEPGPEVDGRLLGQLDDLPRLLSEKVVDEVLLCLPLKSFYERTSQIAAQCEEQGILVRVAADLFDPQLARSQPERVGDTPVITMYTSRLRGRRALAKRLVDLVGAGLLVVLTAPLAVVMAIAIRLDSPGPVIFRQRRVGLNRWPFTMYKFRTMHEDADERLAEVEHLNEEEGPAFKIRGDPRITRVGRWIRRLSLDELPQLWNVVRGEMSLVGPRPLFKWEFDRIEDAWIKRRCSVKPGITGLWQVSGRSDLPFSRRIELDLEYIDTWSLSKDFRILARTVSAVASGRGAV